MTGTNAINYYAPQIFTNLGIVGNANSLFATGVYGIVKMVSCALFLIFLVDTLGRKKSFIWTATAMGLLMFYLGFYVRFDPPVTGKAIGGAGYVAPGLRLSLCGGIPIRLGPRLLDLRLGDSDQQAARTKCQLGCRNTMVCLSTPSCIHSGHPTNHVSPPRLFNFVVARATPVMLTTVGAHGYGTYFIFGSFCFCMLLIAIFFVPETKGISLERMDELFGVANFSGIEDVGVAAQTGHLGKAEMVVERRENA